MRNNKTEKQTKDKRFFERIGIRGRILSYLTLFVIFILSLVWLCQIALLFQFYRNYRTGQIDSAAQSIINNLQNDDINTLADKLSADNDLCILLLDEDGNTVASGDHVRFCLIHKMNDHEYERFAAEAPEDFSPAIITMAVTPFANDRYKKNSYEGPVPEEHTDHGFSLVYIRKVAFENGKTGLLLLNATVSPMGTTIATLSRQFIFISVSILLATLIIGKIMSRSISYPIIETNRAAKELSRFRYERPNHSGGYREIDELNDTLIRAARDLNRVETMQRELIANISHDLRTPLTMIEGYAEVMRDIPEENTPENLQIIIDETNRLTSLVNEVLRFSKLQNGNMEMEKERFDLTAEIRAICIRVNKMTGPDGYTVAYDNGDEVEVYADKSAMGQVVYNLIGNALTYTGEDKRVEVRQQMKGSKVRIEISDSGKGISKEDLPYIWDRYYRSGENHKRAVIGSGLGLSIVRSILEKHEATYGVESTEGAGTTFWFELETDQNLQA